MNMKKKTNTPASIYRARDLSEAACLLTVGRLLLRLDPVGNGRGFFFVFDDEPLCLEIARSFWSGELTVSARAYATAIKTLKDRVFAQPT